MSDILVSEHQTLHPIGISTGNVHIQSKNGENFRYGLPTQEELDDGNIKFSVSQNGYVLIPIHKSSPRNSGMIALKSQSAPVSVRLWADALSSASAESAERVNEGSAGEKGVKGNLSIVLWILGLVVVFYSMNKKR